MSKAGSAREPVGQPNINPPLMAKKHDQEEHFTNRDGTPFFSFEIHRGGIRPVQAIELNSSGLVFGQAGWRASGCCLTWLALLRTMRDLGLSGVAGQQKTDAFAKSINLDG